MQDSLPSSDRPTAALIEPRGAGTHGRGQVQRRRSRERRHFPPGAIYRMSWTALAHAQRIPQISDYAESSAHSESELSEPEPDVDELASEDEVGIFTLERRVFCLLFESELELTRSFYPNCRV